MQIIDEEKGVVRGSGPSSELPPASEWDAYEHVEYEVTDRDDLTYKLVHGHWVTKQAPE